MATISAIPLSKATSPLLITGDITMTYFDPVWDYAKLYTKLETMEPKPTELMKYVAGMRMRRRRAIAIFVTSC